MKTSRTSKNSDPDTNAAKAHHFDGEKITHRHLSSHVGHAKIESKTDGHAV